MKLRRSRESLLIDLLDEAIREAEAEVDESVAIMDAVQDDEPEADE